MTTRFGSCVSAKEKSQLAGAFLRNCRKVAEEFFSETRRSGSNLRLSYLRLSNLLPDRRLLFAHNL